MKKLTQENEQIKIDPPQDKKMSKKARLSAIFREPTVYCLLAVSVLFVTCVALDLTLGLSITTKIAVFLLLFIALYATGALKARQGDEKYMRKVYFLMIVIYSYFIISATLLDASLGRGALKSISDPLLRREYYEEWFVSFKPFHTVKTIYIDALKTDTLTVGYVIFNAIGNLLILAPLSILIPATNAKLGKVYILLPILFGTTVLIEILQYIFMRGSCDIDDVIFNFVGAAAIWALTKIPPISRITKKAMFPFS